MIQSRKLTEELEWFMELIGSNTHIHGIDRIQYSHSWN
jgi:hypothetical protein